MGGWMGVKAVLRIAYSNQKCRVIVNNFRFIPSPIFKIDSRAVSVKMRVNPNPKGDLTRDFSSCKVDHEQMKYNPVRIR